jgi:protein SCO1/2
MSTLAAAARRVAKDERGNVNVVPVTEDPKTDTPAVLRDYLDTFSSHFTGFVGGNSNTEKVLDALEAPRTEILPPSPEPSRSADPNGDPDPARTHAIARGETVEHGGSVYAFKGNRVVVYTGGTTPDRYRQDFTALLDR